MAALGPISGCAVAGLLSVGFPLFPLPATVRMIPESRSTARILLLLISEMSMVFSLGVRLIDIGVLSFASVAGPPSPEKPLLFGVPAKVEIRFVLRSILRTKWLCVSEIFWESF